MIVKDYFINFWLWWYGVSAKEQLQKLIRQFVFILQYTNTYTMAANLGEPLYQDESAVGVAMGWIVRGLWVWFGGMASIVAIIPFVIFFALRLLLPIFTILFTLRGFLSIISI